MKAVFPWRLFRSIFWTLLILMNVLFCIALGLASWAAGINLFSDKPTVVLLIYFLLSLVTSSFVAYRYSSPLRRLIIKAIRLVDESQIDNPSEEEMLDEDLGEYSDLERALGKIRKKLKRRRVQLAHEREESKALMASLEDAVVAIDLNEKLKYYNSRFATLFLSAETRQLAEKNPHVGFASLLREPEVLNLFKEVLRSGETKYYRLKLKTQFSDELQFFSVTVSPLVNEKTQDVYGALALFHDVSDLKKAEQLRNEFVANASHELRTPLTSIKGYVATLQEDLSAGKSDQAHQFVQIIAKGVDRLNDLVGDMLHLATLEAGLKVKRDAIDPRILTEDVLEHLGSMSKSKQLQIELECQAGTFFADEAKVEQVLTNLLSNAIKYVPANGNVIVQWQETPHELILKVIDNGPGIAREHLPRLFERFYRVDRGRSREVGGTGLGLAIVKHIMQAHGGQIMVKSEPGKGSEFVCMFPRS
jgi:two-component system phosphate regulon sensor histidine kinase PhoR